MAFQSIKFYALTVHDGKRFTLQSLRCVTGGGGRRETGGWRRETGGTIWENEGQGRGEVNASA